MLPAPASNPQHPAGLGDQPPRADLLLPPWGMCTTPCDEHNLGLGGVTPLWGCVCHSLVLATSPWSASLGNAAGDRVAPDPAPPGGASPPRAQRCSLGSAARWCHLTPQAGLARTGTAAAPALGTQQGRAWTPGRAVGRVHVALGDVCPWPSIHPPLQQKNNVILYKWTSLGSSCANEAMSP